MKRIVTFVVPMAPTDSPHGEENGIPATTAEPIAEAGPDQAAASPGAMKVEVVVSDSQANRIINSLLEHGSGNGHPTGAVQDKTHDDDAIEFLIQRELQIAEPGAQDLLERVVKRVERQLITKVYSDCDYVKSRAATRLGINRNTLLKKLREFGELAEDPESTGVAD